MAQQKLKFEAINFLPTALDPITRDWASSRMIAAPWITKQAGSQSPDHPNMSGVEAQHRDFTITSSPLCIYTMFVQHKQGNLPGYIHKYTI